MMPPMRPVVFGDFRLDLEAERLWRGDVVCPLRAKSFAVLRHLVMNRGRLVTKEELFRACWPGTAVSESVLRVSIHEIRAALGEEALHPTFLTTVGRRGCRFEVRAETPEIVSDGIVGRDRDLARLHEHFAWAREGRRQVVFVTGEPGIGKTALLERFLEEVRADSRARVALGQCVELGGGREAYLPLLDLLDRLCDEADGREVIATLERWAPSWLLQMPGLLDAARSEALSRRVPSPNRERMLRELAGTLEALTRERALVIVLEDLHWSDASTIDALAHLAQRTTAARLLVIGTYRPVDLVLGDHPLKAIKQSLHARGRCAELRLELLTRDDVAAYLSRRLASHQVDPATAHQVHHATDGNPLFMTAITDYLLGRGLLAVSAGRWRIAGALEGVVPETLRQLVERQLDELGSDERHVLEAASVVGIAFAVAPVAAATGLRPEAVEDVCARLAGNGYLVCAVGVAVWPDGTTGGSYEFLHALYREVLYRRLAPAQRRRLHRVVAERLEAGYAGRTGTIAATLASHFALAGDDRRTVQYHGEAAAAAKARFADREVILHLQAALERLPRLPETPERAQMELGFLLDLGGAMLAARGYASVDAEAVYRRARELAARLDVPQAEIMAHGGAYTFHVMRGDLRRARDIAGELLTTAERMPFPLFTVIGHTTLGCALFNLAEFADARVHLERADAAWEPGFPRLALDLAVLHRTMLAFTLLHQGLPAAGAQWIQRSLGHAEALEDPFNLSYAHELAAQYHATAGDRDAALRHADVAIALANEHGFPVHAAVATAMRGWALRDSATIREGIEAYERLGQHVATSFFRALLAEAELEQGRVGDALDVVRAALASADETGEHRHLAELHRLWGECMLRSVGSVDTGSRRRIAPEPAEEQAEASFQRAITVAREQGARLWELRAVTSRSQLWRAHGRKAKARTLLDDIYAAFTEGFDSPDLVRARELRAQL